MTSPQKLLREAGIRPRKAWGQNFLVHADSARKIVAWADVRPGTAVLEIGPGLGALTEALLETGCHVIAVEKDRGLCEILSRRWPDEGRLQLFPADFLDVDLADLARAAATKLDVVSNLPYSVSTPILEKLLASRDVLDRMCLLLQEEVVDRMTSAPGTSEYGRLTIWVQTLCEVEKGPRIPRGSFYPEPDVDSRLVRLTPRIRPRVPPEELPAFLQLVARMFQRRRKTLRNALREKETPGAADQILARAGIDPQRRPETLSVEEILALVRAV